MEIQSDIPVPGGKRRTGFRGRCHENMAKMTVGQSFAPPAGASIPTFRTYVHEYNEPISPGGSELKAFTVRKYKDGFRCWRLE